MPKKGAALRKASGQAVLDKHPQLPAFTLALPRYRHDR